MRTKAIALSLPLAALLLIGTTASSAYAATGHRAAARQRQHANGRGIPGLPDYGVTISAPQNAAAGDTVQITVTTFETTGTPGTGSGALNIQILGDTTVGSDMVPGGGVSNCNGGGPIVVCQFDQSSPSGNVTLSVTINSGGPTGQVAIGAQLIPVPPTDGDPSNNIANATITVGSSSPTPTPTPSTSPTDTSTPPPDTSVPPTSDVTPVGGIQTGAGGTASSFPVVPVALGAAVCALTAVAWLVRRRVRV